MSDTNDKTNRNSYIKPTSIIGIVGGVFGGISGLVSVFYPNKDIQEIAIHAMIILFIVSGILLLISFVLWMRDCLHRSNIMYENVRTLKENIEGMVHTGKMDSLPERISALETTVSGFQNICDSTRSTVTECQNNILLKLDLRSRFKYNTIDVTKELSDLLDTNNNIDEIRIICFGRSGYGDIVQHISEKSLNIKVNIIVCNPKRNKFICRKDDEEKINQHIKHMLENNVTVFVSDIPPAIRASAVYVKGNPIWCAIQSYQFEKGESGQIEMVRPKESLIVTCNEGSSKSDFDGIVKCFENEYARLTGLSKNPTLHANKKVSY